ncbi:FecR family protein [Asticcacaulis endophyticus]|uniref:Iron dicitrate transporter FecR n=1 Tax=Asticcacaulis endophyticus TaxID=1395890 RepID=A0A918USW5_9CAUL|nr:FecR family protein [Asticcacaulis endophyticus]GGZ32727.1 iron dicitrate transporter FecR [Asticcacaulis endophyticus]
MTTPLSDTDDALFEEASRWHLRRRESPDAKTEHAFQVWLAGGSERAEAMREAEALFSVLGAPALAIDKEQASFLPRNERHRAPPAYRKWQGYAIAASLAIAVIGGTWLTQGGYYRLRGDTVTAVGETRTLRLNDGSVITLNTDTALNVAYSADTRRVHLKRGEAYFEVAHNPARPFIVDSPSGSARVLGTAFDVRYDTQRTHVSVVKGAVGVQAPRLQRQDVLMPGQSAWVSQSRIDRDADRDPIELAAWRKGQLVFYRAPLSEVVDEISRYRRGVVVLASSDARQKTVTGVFNIADPDVAIDAVIDTLALRTVRMSDKAILIY